MAPPKLTDTDAVPEKEAPIDAAAVVFETIERSSALTMRLSAVT